MNRIILILIDDVHLEGREESEQQEFAKIINQQIAKIKEEQNIPIVICAGDIGEGTNGVKWAAQLNSEVIYICGNHEFWGQDFYEVNKNIREFVSKPENEHIKFLSNDTINLHGIRFIGSTLWTSMADYLPWQNKNHIIRFYAAMGDFKRSYAAHWYTPQNEQRLRQFLSSNGVEEDKIKELIFSKNFNPLLEREENHKSLEYLVNELSNEYNGKTIVISHHLPVFETWMKKKKLSEDHVKGEFINNERQFYEAAKGNDSVCRDVLMMGYYANDLKDLMYGEFAPDYWFHGHLHTPMFEIMGRTKIMSSPVGYQKQSSEIKYKLIDVADTKKILKNYLIQEIENYDWNNNVLSTLKDLESSISKFELAIHTKLLTAYDFEPILKNFQKQHELNLKDLKKTINNWLKLFVYDLNNEINAQEIDYFIVLKLSGILDFKLEGNRLFDGKYKFPEKLAAAINDNSFLPEDSYKNANKNNLQYYHYKEWIKEIQKIQSQINNLRKILIEYTNAY